jgi:transcriptional regulator with AAA-type ATPase domain
MSSIEPGQRPVLVSWLAVRHDPYNPDDDLPGPTLTFLCDPESPYQGVVEDFVLFYNRRNHEGTVRKLEKAIQERSRGAAPNVHARHLPVNPIDHQELFDTLRALLREVRDEFSGRELAIHVSPGTPAAHTVWVLLAETGLIEPPFRLYQTLRRSDRGGSAAIAPVEIGLDTPLRSFQQPAASRSAHDEGSDVRLDPSAYESDRRQEVFDRALRYAGLNVPIMILGERGTGKSQLADWIRLNSPFRKEKNDDAPPKVACGQFSGDLVRSEIFGHREGAFTGATSDRDGLLKAADGDTLFLDEIADLSAEVQRLLIRAIENKEYTPHGSDQTRESDFRLITATNVPEPKLGEALAADFLDRVSYFTLDMPPLRETPEDLPVLWSRVLQVAASRADVSDGQLDRVAEHRDAVLRHLQDHPLPGNFRDLFSLAYHLFAEMGVAEDLSTAIDRAARNALYGGRHGHRNGHERNRTKEIRSAFGEDRPLSPWVLDQGPINTTVALDQLRHYLAREIRRLARLDDDVSSPSSICDVSDRSLQKWVQL